MNELSFLFAYALTLSLEAGALFLILRKQYGAQTMLLNSIIASSITLPFVWFVFPKLGLGWAVQTAIAELFAFIVEAIYYKKTFTNLGWNGALFVSFACNSVSFGIGLLLL